MREKTINALVEMGANMSVGLSNSKPLDGFVYIVSIMQLYEENGFYFTNMRICFEVVARQHNTTWENVMNCVNEAIQNLMSADNGSKGAAVVKYLGFMPKTSGNFLAMMYRRLKEEE